MVKTQGSPACEGCPALPFRLKGPSVWRKTATTGSTVTLSLANHRSAKSPVSKGIVMKGNQLKWLGIHLVSRHTLWPMKCLLLKSSALMPTNKHSLNMNLANIAYYCLQPLAHELASYTCMTAVCGLYSVHQTALLEFYRKHMFVP